MIDLANSYFYRLTLSFSLSKGTSPHFLEVKINAYELIENRLKNGGGPS